MAYQFHDVPDEILGKWQHTTDVMAEIFDVPAGLIMRVHPEAIEVLISAHKEGNPYEHDEKAKLNTGLYCETVMATRDTLAVPNALQDPHWAHNPDVALNMIAYLGVPLLWPDNEVFGTICVLDSKTRVFSPKYVELLWELKRSIEGDFGLIQQQQRLAQTNAELLDAVKEVTRYASQLEDSNLRLHEAMDELKRTQARLLQSEKNAALGALVVGVSHELNTPLGNGLMAASTLHETVSRVAAQMEQGLTRTEARKFVQTAKESSELVLRSLNRAASLVNNFKQIAVDRSDMKLCTFSLRDALDEVMAHAALAIRSGGHQVRTEMAAPIEMHSCPAALGHVLGNLLDNALKHAFDIGQTGAITINASLVEGDRVCLQVQDSGRGIAPDLLGRIFDPFVTTRLGQGSSGLGLHAVYNLVHTALHGTIDAHSQLGQGSCFTVLVPRVLSSASDGMPPEPRRLH